jgi:hypothetical protein
MPVLELPPATVNKVVNDWDKVNATVARLLPSKLNLKMYMLKLRNGYKTMLIR